MNTFFIKQIKKLLEQITFKLVLGEHEEIWTSAFCKTFESEFGLLPSLRPHPAIKADEPIEG